MAVLASLIVVIAVKDHKISKLSEKVSDLTINLKAYEDENSSLSTSNMAFRYTIDQYKSSRDSVISRIRDVQKELDIRNSELKEARYLLSVAVRSDTISLRDTIFRDNFTGIDTLVGDQWFSVNIGLKYPGSISVSPKFTSELYLLSGTRRETVNERRKFFLWRLFQKKHTVLTINIKDYNPYVEIKKSKFIEIID